MSSPFSPARRPLRTFAVVVFFLALAAVLVGIAQERYYRQAYPFPYREIISKAAKEENLPVELVLAVIRTESSFRPDAVSSIGARGVMQITEETFDWVKSRTEPGADTTYQEMYDPQVAIPYGCALLRLLLDEFGSTENALCAYHAGWGTVKQWLSNPDYATDGQVVAIPYGDTRAYVAKVQATARIYRSIYGAELDK